MGAQAGPGQRVPNTPRGTLAGLGGLTGVAGFTDGMVFALAADTFVANQSGNLILIGVDLGAWETERLGATLVSIVSYIIGASVGAGLRYRATTERHQPPGTALLVATGLGLCITAVMMVVLVPVGKARPPAIEAYPLIAVAAVSMGLMAFVIREVRGTAVLATAAAGALTNLVEFATRSRLLPEPTQRPAERDRAAVFAMQVGAYVAGAATAAALGLHTAVGHWVGVVPPLVFAVCVWLLVRRRRDEGRSLPVGMADGSGD